MTTASQPLRPRSLADDLRLRSDEALEALLQARPDLVHPVPADIAQLAARAATPQSVSAALDTLNHLELSVCQALACLGDSADRATLHAGLEHAHGYTQDGVDGAIERLRELALIWGDGLLLVRAAREAFGAHPCGLAHSFADSRRTVREYGQNPQAVRLLLDTAPQQVAEIVAHLAWNPTGTMRNAVRPTDPASARTPLEWLLAHDLIVATSDNTVVMPREVALAIRHGALLTDVSAEPSDVAIGTGDQARIDAGGVHAGIEALRLVDVLLDTWSYNPPAALRAGGLSVRDVTASAVNLQREATEAVLLIEVAHAAGLIGTDASGDIVPTTGYDRWSADSQASRWVYLATAWRDLGRAPHLCTDAAGDKPNPLSQGVERPYIADLRRTVLGLIAEQPVGTMTNAAAVCAHLEWQRPRRSSVARNRAVEAVMHEAQLLGVMSGGALTSFGRALIVHEDAVAAMAALVPAPVDHIIVQADLTALAPGQLNGHDSRMMATIATIESAGVATTYRFSESSVRRALDAGLSAFEIEQYLSALSRTPLPQPLTYLIADVARTHGSVRVGAASVYLRCDDDQLVHRMTTDKRLAGIKLRSLAPGILMSTAPADIVLEKLRNAGYAPVAESPDGEVVLHRPDARRTSGRPRAGAATPISVSPKIANAAVRALRAGQRAAEVAAEGGAPRTSTADTVAILREALEASTPLLLGYADRGGANTQRIVEPMAMSGGFLTAFDPRSGEVRTFTVARITGARLADEESA